LATFTKIGASSIRGPATTLEVYLSIQIVKFIFPSNAADDSAHFVAVIDGVERGGEYEQPGCPW
jgi:uncharacterized protein (DUF736 family)